MILSKKRARFEIAWKAIEQAYEQGDPVIGRVIEVVKGSLILDLGVRGFLPASLVDIRRVQGLDEFLHTADVDERRRQKPAHAEVEDETALDDLDHAPDRRKALFVRLLDHLAGDLEASRPASSTGSDAPRRPLSSSRARRSRLRA